jgi:hypothetical protein
VAAVAGVATVTVVAAAVAALAFERLAAGHLGSGARPAALVFAISTVVSAAIGQWPFLAGEALGLAACWAASRRKWVTAAALALGATLMSPLAGLFVAMAMAAWFLACRRRQPWGTAGVVLAALAPIAAAAVLFPGQGRMPYQATDYAWEIVVAAALWAIASGHRVVRAGALVFAAVATAAVLVPSPLGGNVGRMEDALALPLAVGLLWPLRPRPAPQWPRPPRARPVLPTRWARRLVLPAVAGPLLLSQWGPAWGAMTSVSGQASTQRSYFTPFAAALTMAAAGGPAGRVEVVPTEFHREAVYVAPVMPMARGWERQLDEADNPLFYSHPSHLNAATYRTWLLDNGVRFVAVADAPLDFSGRAEARLVAAGVPGLQLIWRSTHWRLYRVEDSFGIVAAPARLIADDGTRVVVSTPAPGPVLVRVRYSPDWQLASGQGCVTADATAPGVDGGMWIRVTVPRAEEFSLSLSLSLRLRLFPNRTGCSAAS